MQIVIDINDELYEYFSKRRSMHDDGYFSHVGKLIKALRGGSLLPKGHGKLGDLGVLAHKMCMADIDDLDSEEVAGLMLWFCDKAPTIIEADKENE